MSNSSLKIVLFLLAVLMVGGVYMYVFKPNMDETNTIKSETETLEARLNELRAKEKNREVYESETKEYEKMFQEQLKYFPASYDQELSIDFIRNCELAFDGEFEISSVGLAQPSLFYTLGSSTDSEGNFVGGYECYAGALPISYTGTYDSIKDFIQYIMDYKYRMNIDTVSIAYDAENDIATGTLNMNAYYVVGADRVGDTVEVDVPTGVANIFVGGEGAPTNTNTAHDEDNGASIKSSYDIQMMLNNANNDTAEGIIVAAGGADTYVTSADNAVVDVNLTIFDEDGKTYVTYAIGSQEYTAEVTGKDLKIYVSSSKRVDGDDTNGVKVNVDNKTSLSVFILVDGDDSSAPRFELGKKNGTVKVY